MIIKKHVLEIGNEIPIEVPQGSELIGVLKSGDFIFVSFIENENNHKRETRYFTVVKENTIIGKITGDYIGTVQMFYDRISYYIFENKKNGGSNERKEQVAQRGQDMGGNKSKKGRKKRTE